MDFDDIIVGAGSSGAVLAARLSEDPARKVLLLESGPDYASLEATPADLRGPDPSMRDHDWGLRAFRSPERRIPYPRGKVVGGSSAVNGAIALRGVPADYDEWAQLGNPAWAYREVLPYFKRLEADELGESELHGARGPIPIRRYGVEQFCATQLAAQRAFHALGFAQVRDHNAPDASGVGPIPLNIADDVRVHPVSTAPMGPDGDAGAVVDQACCVKGVEGLRVVDASIMPTIPRANTNLPCIMIAERVADLMRASG